MDRHAKTRTALLFTAPILALALFGFDRYAAYAHLPSPDSKRIVIYTTDRCGYCEKLRRDLAVNKVTFVEYDVEKTLQGQLGMWVLRGRGVPVSAIGPTIVYGYRVDKIGDALTSLGYSYKPASRDTLPGQSGP